MREEFPNLAINAQSVISKYNVDDIEETIRQLRDDLDVLLSLGTRLTDAGETPASTTQRCTSNSMGPTLECGTTALGDVPHRP